MSAGVKDIVIRFIGDPSSLNSAAASSSSKLQKWSKVGAGALLAFGAVAGTVLKNGIQGLQEGEEAESAFAQAAGKIPKAMKVNTDSVQAYAEQVQKLTKFSYEEALGADAVLVANDGVQKGLKAGIFTVDDLTKTTLDLATAQGVDATSAAKLMAKALASPDKAVGLLKKSGVVLSAKTGDMVKALVKAGKTAQAQSIIYDAMREKVDGAAEAAGNTMVGKAERAQNALGELQEGIASGVLPAFQGFLDAGLRVSGWLQDNPKKVKVVVTGLVILAATIGTVMLAIRVWTAATVAWTVVTKLATATSLAFRLATLALNAAFVANPIGVVIAVIVALVAAVIIAYKKFGWFRDAVNGLWAKIKDAFGWIKSNWPLLLGILTGPIGWAVIAIVKNFDNIKAAAVKIKDGIVSVFGGVADVITAPFRLAVEGIRTAWNSTLGGKGFHAPDWVPGIGGKGFTIPMLASGGRALREGLALVGEKGPELISMRRGASVIPLDQAGDSGGGDIHLTLDLGEGISQVVTIKGARAARALKRTVSAGGRRVVTTG